MAKILNLDDMLEVITSQGWPGAATFKMALEKIGTDMGALIAERYGVLADEAEAQGLAFGGTCVAFNPTHEGQECPQAFEDLDPGGDWRDESIPF